MAAAIVFSGGTKALTAVTGTVSGAANGTAYLVTAAALGHTQTIRLTTNGSGGATFPFVPWTAGVYTFTLSPAAATTTATATLTIGGHC